MNDLRDRITAHVDQSVPPIEVEELIAALSNEVGIRRIDDRRGAPRLWWQSRWAAVAAGAAIG